MIDHAVKPVKSETVEAKTSTFGSDSAFQTDVDVTVRKPTGLLGEEALE